MSLMSGVTCHTRRASTPCTSNRRKARFWATTCICEKTSSKIGPTSSGFLISSASPNLPVRSATSSRKSSFQSVPSPSAMSGTPAAAILSASCRQSSSPVVWPSVSTMSRLATSGERCLAISARPARRAGAIDVPPPASSRFTRDSSFSLSRALVAEMITSVCTLKVTTEMKSVGSSRLIIVLTASRNCFIFWPLMEPLRSRTRLKLRGKRACSCLSPGRVSK